METFPEKLRARAKAVPAHGDNFPPPHIITWFETGGGKETEPLITPQT